MNHLFYTHSLKNDKDLETTFFRSWVEGAWKPFQNSGVSRFPWWPRHEYVKIGIWNTSTSVLLYVLTLNSSGLVKKHILRFQIAINWPTSRHVNFLVYDTEQRASFRFIICFNFVALLDHLGATKFAKCSKTALEVEFSRNWYHVWVSRNWYHAGVIHIFHTTSSLMTHSMLLLLFLRSWSNYVSDTQRPTLASEFYYTLLANVQVTGKKAANYSPTAEPLLLCPQWP